MLFIIIHLIFSLMCNWSTPYACIHQWLNIPQLKLALQNRVCCEKYLKDNKHNSLCLAWKYAQIFVLQHFSLYQSSQFASWNRECPWMNTQAYFHAKWSLITNYAVIKQVHSLNSLTFRVLNFAVFFWSVSIKNVNNPSICVCNSCVICFFLFDCRLPSIEITSSASRSRIISTTSVWTSWPRIDIQQSCHHSCKIHINANKSELDTGLQERLYTVQRDSIDCWP